MAEVKNKKASVATPEKETVVVKKDKAAALVKPQFNAQVDKRMLVEEIHQQAIFDSILSERASRRQGTHQVKNRAAVSGSGKKPWKQKGTGRARHSSRRSPIWVGGGRAFGPQSVKNYSLKVNKKVKQLAFRSALTMLVNDKAVLVEDFKMDKISTKDLIQKLKSLNVDKLRHVVLVSENATVFKSSANLKNVTTLKAHSLNVETLVRADVLLVESESMKLLTERVLGSN
ncbi:50S ribosomal protein L4 [Mycoplasmopsis synoviae]|uniref:50S ribosomal protein L4 n=1 Tax=Mycoplasmopsis synoviae TaxID=2109 RepID=UPI001CE220F2|nr:50S ribosomal protein L4 [Mycoplasmopsis synoviae]UBX97585.1 50S ribosomal protein L4 [Mycoplasmopsis synoviae]UBX98270.1 50S ribosomal protein L4 [Mycoplasmopsis synoviae]UBX98628.1 50S ribosomal protein L4 [Mycoplasmopsis synoviae]UBX99630.1 50S ribosomal protein L4 [Mycoplasmopsis synoviae]UBX99973.1 50S ribosomal protein L4 [Mycoplasmopsis synoviae]